MKFVLRSYLERLSRPTSVRLYEVVPIALLLAPLPFLGALLLLVARPPSPTPAAGGPVTLVGGQLALQVAEGPVVVVVSAPAKHPLMVNFKHVVAENRTKLRVISWPYLHL